MKTVLISGLSGSGKTVALNLLEDSGFFCVDNLPLQLLPQLVDCHFSGSLNTGKLGISIDVRSNPDTAAVKDTVARLRADGHSVDILFLEADEDSLMRRFSETRRSHPLAKEHITLPESLQRERDWLNPLRELAYCIDTSHLTAQQLRRQVSQWLHIGGSGLLVSIESFGFKYGGLQNADFIFDVRSLPNPYYDPVLRPFNGKDEPIRSYLAQQPAVGEMIADIEHFLRRWLPRMADGQRSYVTVGIGCTGGQHRSVYITEQLAQRLGGTLRILVRHRQLSE